MPVNKKVKCQGKVAGIVSPQNKLRLRFVSSSSKIETQRLLLDVKGRPVQNAHEYKRRLRPSTLQRWYIDVFSLVAAY